MLGVFDSGFGGLTILRALHRQFPQADFLYLGDNARAPYGDRTPEDIYQCTREGVAWLFAHGATVVILGCNTASANALRRLQQEWLPLHFPHRRVLGILAPTVEAMSGVSWEGAPMHDTAPRHVMVFATPATVASHAYAREITKRNANVLVTEIACPELAPLIERHAARDVLAVAVRAYVHEAVVAMSNVNFHFVTDRSQSAKIDAVLLGCTHYALIADLFVAALPPGLVVHDQGRITADAFARYCVRHPEHGGVLRGGGSLQAYTTGDIVAVSRVGTAFFGRLLVFQEANMIKADG